MDASFLSNLIAYSAQIAVIVGAGGLAARALRIDVAAVRYAYWRVLLGACLLLPWLQGRDEAAGTASVSATILFEAVTSGASAAGPAAAPLSWVSPVLQLLAIGTALRLVWLGAGLVRLRRLRTAGTPAPAGEHDDLQRAIGTRAEIRYVEGITQPVTFGTFRPVVLLPPSLRDRRPHIARAVISHELFHVRRRDWSWTLAEEVVRAAFWFHPAMWWAVSRVQLAREEAVDELVVLAIGQRRTYLEALLAFADEAPLAPAAAFARRRHLYRRMLLISREAVMSSKRVVITCAVMATIVVGGGWYAVRAFPLMQDSAGASDNGPGPLERRAKRVTPENPIPRRTYSVMPVYPPEAAAMGLTAVVSVMTTLDEYGRVGEARVLNMGIPSAGVESNAAGRRAMDALRRATVDAVKNWQYDAPAEGPISFTATLIFRPQSASAVEAGTRLYDAATVAPGVTGGRAGAAPPPPPPPPPPPGAGARGGAVGGPVPGAISAPAPGRPIRIGGAIRQPAKTTHVNPIYPQEAQDAGVQGIVIIEAVILADGRVGEARVLRSIPLLDQAALDAVKQWEFAPTLLNGAPTAVIMTVTVNFSLS